MTPAFILESAIRATVLGVAAYALVRFMRIRHTSAEWRTWLAVLLIAAAIPVTVVVLSRITPASGASDSVPQFVQEFIADYDDGPAARVLRPVWTRTTRTVVWLTYVVVSVTMLARLIAGLVMVGTLWRRASPVPSLSTTAVPVRWSTDVATPVATGAGILLPRDWSQWTQESLMCVLAHERSHVDRRDFLWHAMARMYTAVFWLNPFAWWLQRRIALLAEVLSDDAALAADGKPAEYASLLLAFSVRSQKPWLTIAIAHRAELSMRIERILHRSRRTPVRRSSLALMASVLVAIAAPTATTPWLRVSAAAPRAIEIEAESDLARASIASADSQRTEPGTDASARVHGRAQHAESGAAAAAPVSRENRPTRLVTLAPLTGRLSRLEPSLAPMRAMQPALLRQRDTLASASPATSLGPMPALTPRSPAVH